MKVIFMAKETESSKAALQYLLETDIEIVRAVIRKRDEYLQLLCKEHHIIICTEEKLMNDYRNGKFEADYILSFYWKKIGQEVLQIPYKGSINFHPGPLPEARGSGYHMAILENWGYWGVTAHFMDSEFDTGPIIECRRFKIDNDIVNKDLVSTAHKYLSLLFKDIIDDLRIGKRKEVILQEGGRYFSISDLESKKHISENDTVEDIDRKIKAFWNPPYSGASIEIKGKSYTLVDQRILDWVAERIRD